MRTIGSLGFTKVTTTVMATRGERLPDPYPFRAPRPRPEPFVTEVLGIAENDTDNRIRAHIVFDVDDIDAAFEELDPATSPAKRAPTPIPGRFSPARATLNRRGLFPTTPDWVNIDHRRGISFTPGEMMDIHRFRVEFRVAFHSRPSPAERLRSGRHLVGYGTSQEGSDVEFRGINTLTVEGERVSRCEIFDEQTLTPRSRRSIS